MSRRGFLEKALRFLGVEEFEEEIVEEPYEEEPTVRRVRTRKSDDRTLKAIEGDGLSMKVHLIEARSFNDAQLIANKFRLGVPVIVNLTKIEPSTGRRILDFSAGVVYALRGGITPVADGIFLLTPKNVEITPEDKRKLRETFFRQFGEGF